VIYQFVATFRDPSLGRLAREAMVELLGVSGDEDDRVVVSPAGGILLVEALPGQRAAVRRQLASLGGTLLREDGMPGSRHARRTGRRRTGSIDRTSGHVSMEIPA
jgi:hypothetical protein